MKVVGAWLNYARGLFMPPEQTAVYFRVAQNSKVSARTKLVSLSFKVNVPSNKAEIHD